MAEAGAKTKTLMRIVVSSIYVDDQDKALASYTTKLGFVKKTEIPVVVPFDFQQGYCLPAECARLQSCRSANCGS
jgi:hypothetical protein